MTYIDELERRDPRKVAADLETYRTKRPSVSEYDTGDERFGLWMAYVNARLLRSVGVGLFDLADWNMRDAYDGGASPKDGAQEALESDDLYASFVGGAE